MRWKRGAAGGQELASQFKSRIETSAAPKGLLTLLLVFAVGYVAGAWRSGRDMLREPPPNFPIQQWRPGLSLDEAKEKAAREGQRLVRRHSIGRVVVHSLEGHDVGRAGLGFCQNRLLYVLYQQSFASARHALEHVSRIAGRPADVMANVTPPFDWESGAGLTLKWWTEGEPVVVELGAYRFGLVGINQRYGSHPDACPS